MNSTRLSKAFFLIAIGCLITNCATTPKSDPHQGYAEFKSRVYSLPLCDPETNGPAVKIQVTDVRVGGKEVLVQPTSLMAEGIRRNITQFVTNMKDHCPNVDGMPADTAYASFRVTFDGTEDLHAASAAAKGFVTGLLTLGVLGHVTPGVYSCTSQVRLDGTRWDGKCATLSASSGEVTVEWDMNDPKAGGRAVSSARAQATDESLRKIAAQLIQEGFFQ